jgi:hypothetical protein
MERELTWQEKKLIEVVRIQSDWLRLDWDKVVSRFSLPHDSPDLRLIQAVTAPFWSSRWEDIQGGTVIPIQPRSGDLLWLVQGMLRVVQCGPRKARVTYFENKTPFNYDPRELRWGLKLTEHEANSIQLLLLGLKYGQRMSGFKQSSETVGRAIVLRALIQRHVLGGER